MQFKERTSIARRAYFLYADDASGVLDAEMREFSKFILESLILAQDERWRHA